MSRKTSPICTICIANYNGKDTIEPCLESVYGQEGDIPIEVIVHDDASTDDSVQFIRGRYSGVKLITSKKNVGFCTSNNLMAREAQGTYILLLNNDAFLHRDALKRLYDFAENLGRPAVLGLPQFDMSTRSLIDIGSLFDPFLNSVPNTNPATGDVGMVSGACLWMPRGLWNELGGFPDRFEYLAEDAFICLKARLWGYPVIAVPRSGFDHWVGKNLGGGRMSQGRLTTTYARRMYTESNKISAMVICYPPPLLCAVLPAHLALLALEGLLLTLLKRDLSIWRNIYAKTFKTIWRRRAWLAEERNAAQGRRTAGLNDLCRVFTWFPYKLRMLLDHGLPSVG